MYLNPLIRFRTLGADRNFLFHGDTGKLYQIPSFGDYKSLEQRYAKLRLNQKLPQDAFGTVGAIPAECVRQLLSTDELPPLLQNDFQDPGFSESIRGHMKLFFVFTSYQCNLDCSYCTYSGLYKKERGHLEVTLQPASVEETLQLIRVNSARSEHVDIVFYGDEPLINFGAIETLVNRLNSSGSGSEYHFQIVTNGLLLKERIIRFCIAKRIKLQLSLDGPQEIHDRYRLTETGKPTHALVMRALERIRKIDKDFYRNMVGLGCTIAPPFEMERIDAWFNDNALFEPFSGHRGNFSVSIMNPTGDSACHRQHPDYLPGDMDALSEQGRQMFERFSHYVLTGDNSRTRFIPSAMYEAPFHNFASRCMEPKEDMARWRHSGECLPGAGGVAVGAEGALFVCSSLNLHPIGSLEAGIDESIVREQRERYIEVRNTACCGCWVNRFCPLCPAAFKYAEGSWLDEMHCGPVRKRMDHFLDLYIRASTGAAQKLKLFLDR
ncbi:MAG: radical SAM protein [Gammaproteobacteria bacterium]|jgi:uncharacterized protein